MASVYVEFVLKFLRRHEKEKEKAAFTMLRREAENLVAAGGYNAATIDGFGIARPNRIIRYTERFSVRYERTEPNCTIPKKYRTEPNRTE